MVNSSEFANRLEKIMEYYDLTATALAEEIDFNRSTISHLISGRNKPSLEFVMKILQKYSEVELEWLVLGKGNFPPSTIKSTQAPKSSSTPTPLKSLDLFSESNLTSVLSNKPSSQKSVERVVVFFTDGTFKNYEN